MARLGNVRPRCRTEPGYRTSHASHAPNIDAERDGLTNDLKNSKVVEAVYEVSGVGPTFMGRNGEGDRYFTDGEVKISRLVPGCNRKAETAVELKNPPFVELKNETWKAVAALLGEGAAAK